MSTFGAAFLRSLANIVDGYDELFAFPFLIFFALSITSSITFLVLDGSLLEPKSVFSTQLFVVVIVLLYWYWRVFRLWCFYVRCALSWNVSHSKFYFFHVATTYRHQVLCILKSLSLLVFTLLLQAKKKNIWFLEHLVQLP